MSNPCRRRIPGEVPSWCRIQSSAHRGPCEPGADAPDQAPRRISVRVPNAAIDAPALEVVRKLQRWASPDEVASILHDNDVPVSTGNLKFHVLPRLAQRGLVKLAEGGIVRAVEA